MFFSEQHLWGIGDYTVVGLKVSFHRGAVLRVGLKVRFKVGVGFMVVSTCWFAVGSKVGSEAGSKLVQESLSSTVDQTLNQL